VSLTHLIVKNGKEKFNIIAIQQIMDLKRKKSTAETINVKKRRKKFSL